MIRWNRREFMQASTASWLLKGGVFPASPGRPAMLHDVGSAFVRTSEEGESWTVGGIFQFNFFDGLGSTYKVKETNAVLMQLTSQQEELMSAIPLGWLGETKDVANAVLFLVSDDARYITGQVICVDGGMVI